MPGIKVGTDESPNEGSGTGNWEEGTDLNDTFRLELASASDHLEVESEKKEPKVSSLGDWKIMLLLIIKKENRRKGKAVFMTG